MEWAVHYRLKGEENDCLVILPSVIKLLWWIVRNAVRCEGVLIAGAREEETDV